MSYFLLMFLVFLLICSAYIIPTVQAYLHRNEPMPHRRRKLDNIGIVTNALLGLFYIPLSLVASLMGMVGEGYMEHTTPVQYFLIDLITFLGIFTFVAAVGSILCSVLLRLWGYSIKSFWMQFGAIFHSGFILLLMWILEYLK